MTALAARRALWIFAAICSFAGSHAFAFGPGCNLGLSQSPLRTCSAGGGVSRASGVGIFGAARRRSLVPSGLAADGLRGVGMDATGIKGSAKIKVLESMKGVDPKEWDEVALATTGVEKMNPFMSWAFLNAVEESRSAHPSTGWQPRHVVAYDSESGSLIGAVPLYLKSHSYGEYVFDNSWARAYGSITREPYYPKLQSCVPFSPVTGPRLLVRGETEEEQEWIRSALAQAVCQLVDTMEEEQEWIRSALAQAVYQDTMGVSSAHVTFPAKREWELMGEQKWVQRTGIQYHWNNQGWQTFDDFLAALKQSKRKNIRSERSKVSKQGVKVHRLTGSAIEEKHWDAFYKFYTNTVDEHWGQAYLTRSFFSLLSRDMADNVLLIMAEEAFFSLLSRDMADNVLLIMAEEESTGEWVAGALNLVGGDCIYGRNWGCTKQFNSLHFELCYYQAIDAAIEMKKDRVEAGAQ
ncbi:hypothetical protein T484DRAFT_1817857, partial [Baffinella frigidus]